MASARPELRLVSGVLSMAFGAAIVAADSSLPRSVRAISSVPWRLEARHRIDRYLTTWSSHDRHDARVDRRPIVIDCTASRVAIRGAPQYQARTG